MNNTKAADVSTQAASPVSIRTPPLGSVTGERCFCRNVSHLFLPCCHLTARSASCHLPLIPLANSQGKVPPARIGPEIGGHGFTPRFAPGDQACLSCLRRDLPGEGEVGDTGGRGNRLDVVGVF